MNRQHRQSGQGLMETLAVLLLISISIVGFLKYQHYQAYSNSMTQQQSYANLLATSKMEQLRDYQTISVTSGYSAYSSIASGSGTSTLGGTTYTLTWTVTTYSTPSYKNINITVTWPDRAGVTQTVRLVSNVDSSDPGTQASYM